MGDIKFVDQSAVPGVDFSMDEEPAPAPAPKTIDRYPPPILDLPDETIDVFKIWLDQWLDTLLSDQSTKQDDWEKSEEAYRALPGPKKTEPYIGASNETVSVVAMAVDPIHARLDIGIFKQDPVFTLKGLKKSTLDYIPALTRWIDYYQKHKLQLRRTARPRILEAAKLGTCVFKTIYDRQEAGIMTYDANDNWKVIKKKELRFAGPNVLGVAIGDFLFPPLYQYLQDCPIVAERQRTTFLKLKVAEASKKLAHVDDLKDQTTPNRTSVEAARMEASNHRETDRFETFIEVFEVWCDYDINGDGLPEHMVATYHRDTRTLLQLRYNWYFHQRKPYTVIPYSITNDSLYGLGLCEMLKPIQDVVTKWQRMATDNTYLSNIRMFIAKKGSGIEEVPRLYAGRVFFVDDPKSDFIPFASADIYPSTLAERQNLFGLAEKRSGLSDYLTGRESPIIGSRATATSTLALIQEGTKRVEEVLENFRLGFAEIIENCIYIWIQYGLDGVDEIAFGDDEIGDKIKEFFSSISAENINGCLAIDLTATDASGNRQAMQQMQLQIIQVMMQYYEKLIQAGGIALQALQQQPALAQIISDTMEASRKLFVDLLNQYNVPNPDDYVPDLAKYLNGGQNGVAPGQGNGIPPQGLLSGPGGIPSMAGMPQALGGPAIPRPATPGSGGQPASIPAIAGSYPGA